MLELESAKSALIVSQISNSMTTSRTGELRHAFRRHGHLQDFVDLVELGALLVYRTPQQAPITSHDDRSGKP